jgi:hypothetical protein
MNQNTYYNNNIVEQVDCFAQHTCTKVLAIVTFEKEEQPRIEALLKSYFSGYNYKMSIQLDWSDMYNIKLSRQIPTNQNHIFYEVNDVFFDEILTIMDKMNEKKPFGEDFSGLIYKN